MPLSHDAPTEPCELSEGSAFTTPRSTSTCCAVDHRTHARYEEAEDSLVRSSRRASAMTVLRAKGRVEVAGDTQGLWTAQRRVGSSLATVWTEHFATGVGVDAGWREQLPDPIEVPLREVGYVISELDRLLRAAELRGDDETVRSIDAVVGRMTRWVWSLLGELDDEEDYDG
jgi:hypothetical protein